MYPVKVIPAKVLRNKNDGRIASITGSHPATNRSGDAYDDWEIVQKGFTFINSNGTIGIGRTPFETEIEASNYLKLHGKNN